MATGVNASHDMKSVVPEASCCMSTWQKGTV